MRLLWNPFQIAPMTQSTAFHIAVPPLTHRSATSCFGEERLDSNCINLRKMETSNETSIVTIG